MVQFNKEEIEILKTHTKGLLRTCEMSFASVPEKYKGDFDPEKWQDQTLDMGLELKKSLEYLVTGNMRGYNNFLSSEYSLSIKKIIDDIEKDLLDYFNPYQNRLFKTLIGKNIAKSKLNTFRNKLGLPQI